MRQRKIYKASELPGKIQDELHEKNYYVLVEDSDWWECEWENFQSEKTIETGLSFEEKSLEFDIDRGSYAKFKYSIEDTNKLLEVLGYSEQFKAAQVFMKLAGLENTELEYEYDEFYWHVYYSSNAPDNAEETAEETLNGILNTDSLNEVFKHLIEDLQKQLLNNLRQCYDGDTSKEAVIDFLDNNGYGYYYNRRAKEYEEADRYAIDEQETITKKLAA